jgi:predicted RNA-binding Zn-ribbon protein involved in translation (DUF1610 family)
MAKIEVNCPTCGAVLCRGADFSLRTWEGTGTYYLFDCPMCGETVQRLADTRTVEILIAEGAPPPMRNVPPEFFEPHAGPPLTIDDLLDFHMLLEGGDWFDRIDRQRDNA